MNKDRNKEILQWVINIIIGLSIGIGLVAYRIGSSEGAEKITIKHAKINLENSHSIKTME